MDKAKLQQHLYSDTTHLYCVLDGASVPDLPKRLFDTGQPNYCLFPGELEPGLVHTAPYVVFLGQGDKFTEWVLSESFGNHWGIFIHCRHSMIEMRRHFRGLVNVYDEKGVPLIFRYYDPRVLCSFLPMCDAEQLKTFFGKVETFFAENGKDISAFRLENEGLKQSELN